MTKTAVTSVPLLDLKRQQAALGEETWSALREVVEAQIFIMGKTVTDFEEAISRMHGVAYGIGVASGTDALLLPLKTLDLAPGDEVITTAFTFFATAGAIHNAGGRPKFVDIEPDTFNIDVTAVDAAVGPRTRAIVPVHLFGQMADLVALREITTRSGAFLLEDAAQAIGARQQNDFGSTLPGQVGDCASFSFFPSKNLGGFGDGGMVVTDDEALAERLRRLRLHGGRRMYHHEEVGTNSRLDAIQAAVLLAKLPHLEDWSEARRANARWYDERLASLEERGVLRRPVVRNYNTSIYNQYTLRADDRDGLRHHLEERRIGSAVYYPLPLHLQPCFEYLGYRRGELPESERAAEEALSIPIFPEISEAERETVASAIEEYYTG